MSVAPSLDHIFTAEISMAAPARERNDPELYLWCMGWLAERYRGGDTLDKIGHAIGTTGAGYKKLEKGASGNLRTWWKLFDYHDKDVVTILTVVRVLVRAIQDEQEARGRELTKEEKIDLVTELYVSITR